MFVFLSSSRISQNLNNLTLIIEINHFINNKYSTCINDLLKELSTLDNFTCNWQGKNIEFDQIVQLLFNNKYILTLVLFSK